MLKKTSLIIGVLTLVLIVSGCGSKSLTERQIEKNLEKNLGEDFQVDLNSGDVSIQTEGGFFQAGEVVKLPEDFPKDVYVIDGKIISAMKNFGGAGYQVMVSVDKSVTEAMKLYDEKLKAEDWVIKSSMDLGIGAVLSANKDSRQVSVSISEDGDGDGGTSVIVTVTDDKE